MTALNGRRAAVAAGSSGIILFRGIRAENGRVSLFSRRRALEGRSRFMGGGVTSESAVTPTYMVVMSFSERFEDREDQRYHRDLLLFAATPAVAAALVLATAERVLAIAELVGRLVADSALR